jgi:hypothetical protein
LSRIKQHKAYFALEGFACSGMGLALVFPFMLSAADKQGLWPSQELQPWPA